MFALLEAKKPEHGMGRKVKIYSWVCLGPGGERREENDTLDLVFSGKRPTQTTQAVATAVVHPIPIRTVDFKPVNLLTRLTSADSPFFPPTLCSGH